ncbi:MAG TPA: FadD3 family acyl-CoA ligase [Kofleriaceae bacterium]|nr:FadD3 family acyl-CoA ligase [Kofleriaceae bacterium]
MSGSLTIGELLERAARERPDDIAVADGDTVLTTAQLRDRAHAAARALVACGVAKGTAVGIWAPNGWPWMVAALGAHTLGAIIVPINTRYKGPEAAHVLERSRARVLVTVDGFLGARYPAMLRDAGTTLPALETIVVAPNPGASTVDAPAGTVAWDAFLAAGERVAPAELARLAAAVTADDVGDIMFTSGTTGRAKAVPATHAQSLRVFADWGALVGLRRGDRYLVVAPFFHTFGYKAGWLAALQVGAVVHPQPQFDVEQVMARIAADRITVLPGPPTLYQSLLDHPARAAADLSSLRLAVTGAACVPVELVRRMRSDLGFDTVLTGYGLTETTGCATLCRDGDDAETVANTSGRAMPGIEVAIVDDTGQPLPAGAPGEVVVRGYNVMRGYVDDAAATAETIDRAGWLRTGDIGVMDERGYLKITDRKKDMFIVGGFNAYPAEIEAVLVQHPAIGQVAVVGAPDERLGEIGVAFVVARPATTPSEAELLAWARDRMANFKVPRRFHIVDALPLNASGKVLKHELRARAGR